ncbi:hypothetical protein [Kitasatospora camelliae]|uniref:Uncharacterized protein n=1 Tax=Kitasatospora camelliae TaxID=3156397 RepID=A0AAU8JS36_9ACTN
MTVINEPRHPLDVDGMPRPVGRPVPRHQPAPPPPADHDQAASSGQRAATRLLGLREVTMPAAVVEAADALLEHALATDDAVTRSAAAATRNRLRAALGLQ